MTIDHWFDFICPHCYVAQDRNRILHERGLQVVGHALPIHPEIGPGGTPVGPRSGPTYEFLAHEAEAAGLPLRWTDRIPYSRPALAAFEWLDAAQPEVAGRFATAVFAAYFGNGLDIESADLLAGLAEQAGGDPDGVRAAAGTQDALVRSERRARERGVTSTPTWIAGGQRVSGVRPRRWFEEWADSLTG